MFSSSFFLFNFLRIEIPCGIFLYFFFSKNIMKNYPGILQTIEKALEFYIKSMFFFPIGDGDVYMLDVADHAIGLVSNETAMLKGIQAA